DCLVADLLRLHFGKTVKGERAVSAGSIGKASRLYLEATSIARVGGRFEAVKAEFLKQCGIGGDGLHGIFDYLRRAAQLPAGKCLGKQGSRPRILGENRDGA